MTRLRAMTAQAFEQQLLHEGLGAHHVVVGHDFHYGTKRAGTVETLTTAGQRLGFTLEEVDPFLLHGERVSSSLVREALESAQLDRAAQLIGRPYRMTGRVRRGQQLGRTLGYPPRTWRCSARSCRSGAFSRCAFSVRASPRIRPS